jgi:hypothetical protein
MAMRSQIVNQNVALKHRKVSINITPGSCFDFPNTGHFDLLKISRNISCLAIFVVEFKFPQCSQVRALFTSMVGEPIAREVPSVEEFCITSRA